MRLRRALDEMVVEGIETTLPLFRALVREPDIIDGDYHIHWLEQYLAGQSAGLNYSTPSRNKFRRVEPNATLGRYVRLKGQLPARGLLISFDARPL